MLVLSWASMAVDTAAAVVSGAGGEGGAVPGTGGIGDIPLSPQGTSDFCVAPDKFIMNQTDDEISAGEGWLGGGGELGQDPKTHLGLWCPSATVPSRLPVPGMLLLTLLFSLQRWFIITCTVTRA